ncbi:pyridoxal phosphate-dependent aminotransferase [Achromobacter ruhlandii]|uniref:Aspartate aminotransferase n=1 Tax=Achromobacter ruhlandii TaxID=72557 RepID=A0A2M9GVH1_9BURK|nr:pyridoxal phosphate-dependent aminotransferase [Achromobacter ruhlandii]OCZ63898.1 aminotransferase [Achromobacter xylosoxidans]MCV6797390.1 pyridoxal phosphate-dependent aminotransferase [Achromobacter ruhlandii]MCV6803167.1 pyridoxal phosphate-dependent aminotransferase [Achromobacter ruhlandii]MCV6808766.1 pyridoxal phosphate-dependent aminotransferase [Achromobacter ruhlandii]MCV6818254.1 pyridoxal phosphate-dependent aminotransferase [Achromobacter ruhlandii]
MPRLAARTNDFLTFQVVELFKQAQALQAAGKDIISLGIGEPDFTAPPQVVEALQRAAQAGQSGYSAPAGLMPLREAIARFYHEQFGAAIDPRRVIVTAGASGALTLACAALVNPGAEVLMPDPSYPANSNFVLAAGGRPRLIPSSADKRFQLSAQDVARHWTEATQGVLVASPSNPTGTSIDHGELSRLLAEVRARQGFAIVDEIYLGLSYEGQPRSALTLDDDIIVINSFSKYFHMTGWRLGWMIVPEAMVAPVEKIAGSLAICAPTLAQHAALACFTPDALRTFEHRREAFRQRRDYLLPEFERLGLKVPVKPDGAFYIYADISDFDTDSASFSQRLLLEAGIAAVPGLDFGPAHGHHTMRFSYATGLDRLEEAVARLGKLLGR